MLDDILLKILKCDTIGIGVLTALAFLTQMSNPMNDLLEFTRSVFGISFSLLIIYLEFWRLDFLYNYASFYYSYLGRGILFIWLGSILSSRNSLNVWVICLLFISGFLFISFEYFHIIPKPTNFTVDKISLSLDDDEDII